MPCIRTRIRDDRKGNKQIMQDGVIFPGAEGLPVIIFVYGGRRVNMRKEKEAFIRMIVSAAFMLIPEI